MALKKLLQERYPVKLLAITVADQTVEGDGEESAGE